MSSHPVKRKARPLRTIEGDVVDAPVPVPKNAGGFSFRYSFAEFSAVGNSARFSARRARYENGKLSAESLEGELDPERYQHLMSDVQRLFAEQTALCLRAFGSFFLPSMQRRDRE